MNIDGVLDSLSSLARNAEDEVPISQIGRNTIYFLSLLESAELKRDLETLSQKTAADKQATSDTRVRTRWECVTAVLDGYYYQYCLSLPPGDILVNRDVSVVGPLGSLINLNGKIIGWLDRVTVAKVKGIPENSVGQNFASAALESVSPQEVRHAEEQLVRHAAPTGGPAAPVAALAWGGVLFAAWGVVKNRVVEEAYYQGGYEEIHANRRHVNERRLERGLPPI